jgi:hypothetical protein
MATGTNTTSMVILKDGAPKTSGQFVVLADGTVRMVVGSARYPVVIGAACNRLGLNPKEVAAYCRPAEALAHPGMNEGGIEVLTADEYHNRKMAAADSTEGRIESIIPGVKALRAARAAELQYCQDLERAMNDENNDGVNMPAPPSVKSIDLAAQYPAAAAYLAAVSFSCSSHDVKCSAGHRAMSRLLAGENYEVVESEMRAEWAAYCNRALD